MSLNGKINALKRRFAEILPEPGQGVFVPVGVWYYDENGIVIEGSGKTMLVSKNQQNAFGTLLVQRPAKSKEEFSEMVRKHNERLTQSEI